jgi:hypothetical protein
MEQWMPLAVCATICAAVAIPSAVHAWRRRGRPNWWQGEFAATPEELARDRVRRLRLMGWQRHQYE